MKGCFYVFNIEKEITVESLFEQNQHYYQRQINAKSTRNYLRNYLPELESNTIEINSEETLLTFLQKNPNFKVIPEAYNNQIFSSEVYDRKTAGKGTGWKYGQLGIWASNYTAWLNFLKTDYDYVMLLEDDVRLKPDFMEFFNVCLENLPQNWEIYHACAPSNKVTISGVLDVRKCDIGNDFVSLPYVHDSNGCYIINRKGVEKILQHVEEGIFLPLDWHWFKQPLFNIYSVKYDKDQKCTLLNVASTHWDTQPFTDLTEVLRPIS